jgi:2-oxo-4-hydroxy-4-carboxy-5-ureidoimidazoline decarboxylase
VTLAQLNAVDEPLFIAAVGPVFEHSPWIAAGASKRRPFADAQALHSALCAVIDEASTEQRVALIAAHPDLAGRVAREGRLTPASRGEQASAGLDELTPTERSLFDVLNAAYRARFAFPFVICAREHSKASILSEVTRRAGHDREVEIVAAIDEIKKIAWLRLSDVLVENE